MSRYYSNISSLLIMNLKLNRNICRLKGLAVSDSNIIIHFFRTGRRMQASLRLAVLSQHRNNSGPSPNHEANANNNINNNNSINININNFNNSNNNNNKLLQSTRAPLSG